MTAVNGDSRAERLRRAIEARKAAGRHEGLLIPSRPPAEPALLGEHQRGIWLAHQIAPESPAYHLCRAFRVSGPLDLARLQRAVDAVVGRHRLLRSTFERDGDTARQVVHDRMPIPVERLRADGDALPAAARDASRPFDLERGPLVRVRLVEDAAGTRILVLTLHHALADERSVALFWDEIADAFEDRLDPGPPPVQFDDYAHWQRSALRGRRREDVDYWRQHLSPPPDGLRLPFERTVAEGPPRGAWIERRADGAIVPSLHRLAAAAGGTPFMIAAFAFRLLLHRYTGGQRVAFGTPVSTRSHAATAGMFGYFLNAVAVAAPVDERDAAGAAAARFCSTLRDALAHASVPFDEVAALVAPPREADRHPIFRVMFVHQSPEPPRRLGEATLEPVHVDLAAAKFDLTLFVTEGPDTLGTAVEFRADRFDARSMDALLGHYETLLGHLARDPDRPLADVPMLPAAEESAIDAWEQGPPLEAPATPLPAAIRAAAARRPQAQAVVCGGARVDYETLDGRARRVSAALAAAGVGPGDRVAVFCDRSIHAVVGILAAHRAGAAYVPVEPASPAQRIENLLQDAAVSAVVATEALRPRLPAGPWAVIDADARGPADREADAPVDPPPGALAYIIYTSGSTGRPKGVAVTHDNLRLSTAARLQVYGTAPRRFLLLSGIAFDSSVAGLFSTLAAGGTLVLPTDDEIADLHALGRLIEEERVSTLLCVPSLYSQLLDSTAGRMQALDTVIVAGETCPSALAAAHRRVLPHVRLFNEYGPTEATVWATVHEVVDADASAPVPIGRPIPGVRVQVQDEAGRRVPAGVPGHAWIAGATVAAGYWQRDTLTADRFLADPRVPGGRRYRTGDLMAWSPEGTLQFLGREDEQIKLRGFRIEPGETEAALSTLPGVHEAVVIARRVLDGPGEPSGTDTRQLVAFITPAQEVDGWRDALAARLPHYQVPARLVALPELPRLPNGKVDRRQLAARPLGGTSGAAAARPMSAREQALLSLWEGLLGRFGIGVRDNFFELGGHSLLAMQMVAAIEQDFGVRLGAADVFQHPTVRALSRRIEDRHGGPAAAFYEQLFPIQPAGRRSPFVMAVPDFFTEALALRFRGERPVYGVRTVSLRPEGNRGRWPTLTHLAEEIAGEIGRRFPRERCILAGYSFGAWVAVETARVLERRGVPAARLYLVAPMPLDFCTLGPFRLRVEGLREPADDLSGASILRLWLRSNHPLGRGAYRRARQFLAERPWRRALSMAGALRRRTGLPLTPALMQADARVERFRLHSRYTPGPVHTETIFFNPRDAPGDAAATWRPYFNGPLTVHQIPDPHDPASIAAARDLVLQHLDGLPD